MKWLFVISFKLFRKARHLCSIPVDWVLCKVIFYAQNVGHGGFSTIGIPYVSVARGATLSLGDGLVMNNTIAGNPIGRSQRSIFFVDSGAKLFVGKNLGISQAAIVCHLSITIGDNVKIGAGVCIYDTDFHSLDPTIRSDPKNDMKCKAKAPVIIHDFAFIGAHSTILKGVTIGKNAVIGACSVISKSIPENEVWAGNPAKRIKQLGEYNNI